MFSLYCFIQLIACHPASSLAIKEKVKDAKVAEAKKRLEAEKEGNKNIAEAGAKKKAEKAAAEAEAAAQAAAEAAPVEEAPAAEAPAAEQNAE